MQTMLFRWGMREFLVEMSSVRLRDAKGLGVYVPLTAVGVRESPEATVKMRVAEHMLQPSPSCMLGVRG